MYRYRVDNSIVYSPEDLVLFRESPFACWMERFTLEVPNHGIAPDEVWAAKSGRQWVHRDAFVSDLLASEGKRFVSIERDMEEPLRRNATLEAMRHGADYIVGGQLSHGSLSSSADLLMRVSGSSELGGYYYLPCDTGLKTTVSAAFRLCFVADLLHSLQGALPPKMLLIRGDGDIVSLRTEDQIFHYRAVKQRFMNVQREFRRHRMPDPAESTHFGRWSQCANDLMRRNVSKPDAGKPAELPEDNIVVPSAEDSGTLAEQARRLPSEPAPGKAEDERASTGGSDATILVSAEVERNRSGSGNVLRALTREFFTLQTKVE